MKDRIRQYEKPGEPQLANVPNSRQQKGVIITQVMMYCQVYLLYYQSNGMEIKAVTVKSGVELHRVIHSESA